MSFADQQVYNSADLSIEDVTRAGRARFCPTRRRSISCSRLEPTPLPDIMQFRKLSRSQENTPPAPPPPPPPPPAIKETPVAVSAVHTMPGVNSSSSRHLVRKSASSAVHSQSENRKQRSPWKGTSWLLLKTWMRKKRHAPSEIATPTVLASPSMGDLGMGTFKSEQVMKPSTNYKS